MYITVTISMVLTVLKKIANRAQICLRLGLLFAFCLMLSTPLKAQILTTPTPFVRQIPTLSITSIAFVESSKFFRVELSYTHQTLIPKLRVKIERARGNTLVTQFEHPTTAFVEFSTDGMTRGESYRVTVTGMSLQNTPLIFETQQSYGAAQQVGVQDERTFEYLASADPTLEIRRLEVDAQTKTLRFEIDLSDGDSIVEYEASLELNGVAVLPKQTLSRRTQQAVMNVQGLANGRYTLILEGIDNSGKVIARAVRNNFDLILPQPSIFENLRNPIVLAVLVVLGSGLLLVVWRVFTPKNNKEEYTLEKRWFERRDRDLLSEKDITIRNIEENERKRLRKPHNAQLLIHKTPDSKNVGTTIDIKDLPYTVGREEPANLVLPYPTVSSRHFSITFEQGQFYIQDHNSTNRTVVNGEPLKDKKPLRNGDLIEVAKVVQLTFINP